MRTIICAVCGRRVEVSIHASRAMYCPECRKKSHNIACKKWREKKEETPHVMDTPENIETCLSCPLPECRMDSARCQLYKKEKERVAWNG